MRRTERHQTASIRLAYQSKDIRRWFGQSRLASQQKLHPLSAMQCAHTERSADSYRVRRLDVWRRKQRRSRTEAFSGCLASLHWKLDLRSAFRPGPRRSPQPPAGIGDELRKAKDTQCASGGSSKDTAINAARPMVLNTHRLRNIKACPSLFVRFVWRAIPRLKIPRGGSERWFCATKAVAVSRGIPCCVRF